MRLSKKIRLGAILLAATAACHAPFASAQDTAPAPILPPPNVAAINQHEIQQLAALLYDPNASPEARDEAARRLVSRQTADARAVLTNTLVDLNNPAGQLSVAKALAQDPHPDPNLISPLFAALTGPKPLAAAAGAALANYQSNPDVLRQLIAVIQRQPPEQEYVRREAIMALGAMPEKRAAATLIEVLKSPDQSSLLRESAAKALAQMTGITDYGRDSQEWSEWWNRAVPRSDADFRSDLAARQLNDRNQLRQHEADLFTDLERAIDDQYLKTAEAGKANLLLQYLRSPQPDLRKIGVRIIQSEATGTTPIPAAVRDQLRLMVGDSSAVVRKEVATALASINDAAALEPLLAQLSIETSGEVRTEIVKALGSINDLRAVPALLKELNDPSYDAALAAGQVLAERLSPLIYKSNDPKLIQQTTAALKETFERRTGNVTNTDLRATLIGAMTPLKQPELRNTLDEMLYERNGESADVRWHALRALGELGDPQDAALMNDAMHDRNGQVRLEAVTALGKNPNAKVYFEPLRKMIDPDNPNKETDESVRGAVWIDLQGILPGLSKEQLADLADFFRKQSNPDRQILVLKTLADKLTALKQLDDLATVNQTIGAAMRETKDYSNAAVYFKASLDYKKSVNPPAPKAVIQNLQNDYMDALLKSKQYPEAIQFAAQCITDDPSNQLTMGTAIKDEADSLQQNHDFENALKLIAEARKMKPALDGMYLDELTSIENEIHKRQKEQGGNPGPGQINTASGQ